MDLDQVLLCALGYFGIGFLFFVAYMIGKAIKTGSVYPVEEEVFFITSWPVAIFCVSMVAMICLPPLIIQSLFGQKHVDQIVNDEFVN
jgi:hypothetical protein